MERNFFLSLSQTMSNAQTTLHSLQLHRIPFLKKKKKTIIFVEDHFAVGASLS